jgi:threonine/homoserine/homoserine lactone efflux protein
MLLLLRLVGRAALLFVVGMLSAMGIGALAGTPVNLAERAVFWGVFSLIWAAIMEWRRLKQQATLDQAREA